MIEYSNYKIEQNVQIPNKRSSNGVADTIKRLKAGESFECELNNRSSAYSASHFYRIKIAIRTTTKGKIRVWRIK